MWFYKLHQLVGHYRRHLINADLLIVLECACEKKGELESR